MNAALRVGGALVLVSSLLAGTAFAAEGGRNPLAEHVRAANVWAWKPNPHGAFADMNPTVSCEHAGMK